MEVETAAEQTLSLARIAAYLAITTAFTVVVLLPTLLSWSYLRGLKTALLVCILIQVLRLVLSSVLSLSRTGDPASLEGERPVVSVVIPAYNEAAVLPETIEACRDLDYPQDNLEFVITYEESCTDATAEIAERAAERYENVTALVGPGEGKARAINEAVRETTGSVVANIDADHRLEPGAVERAVRWFATEPDTWCVKGRCYGRNPTDSIVSLYATVDRHVTEKVELFGKQVFGGFTIFSGGQAFFRREVFEEFDGYDPEMLVEDIDLSARIHTSGRTVRMDPTIITYEEQPASMSAWWNQRKRWARGWLQVSVRYFGDFVRSRASPVAKADAAQTFSFNLLTPALVVGFSLPVVNLFGASGVIAAAPNLSAYVPYSRVLWTMIGLFPVFAAGCVFYSDYRNGLEHHVYEYVAALTLGFYFTVNTAVYVVAFIEEFVLRRPHVFVVTTRAADE